MSTLTILIDDTVVQTFDYDELKCIVESTGLTLTASRGPTGTVRDGLVDLHTGAIYNGLVTPNEARSLWSDQ